MVVVCLGETGCVAVDYLPVDLTNLPQFFSAQIIGYMTMTLRVYGCLLKRVKEWQAGCSTGCTPEPAYSWLDQIIVMRTAYEYDRHIKLIWIVAEVRSVADYYSVLHISSIISTWNMWWYPLGWQLANHAIRYRRPVGYIKSQWSPSHHPDGTKRNI